MEVSFRRAEKDDLPAIIAMLADDALGQSREIISDPPDAAYLDAFARIDSDPNQFLAVMTEPGGAVIGTLQLSFLSHLARRGAMRCQIEAVRVASDARGGGLGEKMFRWAIDEARKRGCAMVQLTTDKARPEAHAFYEKLGFEATHLGFKLAL
ncbi:MAG: GNAT family N-acetyltransferase [Paracoccus sp. (in: a-proteobacteria)]|nr:GNAT family N-acetyltransferase [Paracoccus sp. (in: a-proteobacteria)]